MIICYCIDSINGIGGIQHVTVEKANALAEIQNYSVWILFTDHSGYRYFSLSPRVQTIDLNINYYEDDWVSKWHVLKGILIKRRKHRRELKKALNIIRPDIVIAVGQSEKNLLPTIRGKWAIIREFHYGRNYRLMSATTLFDQILAIAGNLADYLFLRHYDQIVVLTHEDKDTHWKKFHNVNVIPNPIVPSNSRTATLDDNRVIAVGRLAYPKNFDSLIRAYSLVATRFPNWNLAIFGEGNERTSLEMTIKQRGLSHSIHLMGQTPNIPMELLSSSIFALSSRFEGFGLAILEAMNYGLPIVSYACPFGPRDIIRDGVDGFLVPTGNETMLAERICQLIEDKNLRRKMGAAARERAKEFSLEKVLPMWTNLFEELVKEKKK